MMDKNSNRDLQGSNFKAEFRSREKRLILIMTIPVLISGVGLIIYSFFSNEKMKMIFFLVGVLIILIAIVIHAIYKRRPI